MVRPRLVKAPLTVRLGRDPRPDPRGRPRLPLAVGAPPSVPGNIDVVALRIAEAALGCVRGTPERPNDMKYLPRIIWGFSVSRSAVSPVSI